MSRYISGPWRVFESHDHHYIQTILPCINGLSAWFTLASVSNPDESETGYTDGYLDADAASGNAQLMAAAPDLLDALRGLLEIDGWDKDHPRYTNACAAIAKATGA